MDINTIVRKLGDDHLVSDDRSRIILERLNEHGFQSISTLSEWFRVSPQTIRRDVNALCARGLARRSHGGVWPLSTSRNVDYPARRLLELEAKKNIAHCVAEHIPDGASLFLGVGTTVEMCADAIRDRSGLRVMTNNLNAAFVLAQVESCEITVSGGRLRNVDFDIVSAEACGFFARFAADIGIYGVGAVSADGNLLDFQEEEARIHNDLTQHCSQRFLVFDHSKFGRGATVRSGHITDADIVFTDQQPSPAIVEMLDQAGVRLVVSNPDTSPSF